MANKKAAKSAKKAKKTQNKTTKKKGAKRGAARKVTTPVAKKEDLQTPPSAPAKEVPSSEAQPQADKPKVVDAMKERLTAAKDMIVYGLTVAKDFIVNCFKGAGGFLKSIWDKITGFFTGLFSKEKWNETSGQAKFYLNIAFLFATLVLVANYVVAIYGLAITTAILGGGTLLAYAINRATTGEDVKEMVGGVSIKDALTPSVA